ncbi:MAG TPA: biopolymer transporter ExbD, partial [Candidatus Hydrogenedentes bacterium]|nr:biopolymer transporter ExbD [Candidatus Hydrogenedentota bacterium]
MANAAQKHGQQVFGEINITPLTDIFLVLLIIMMVVAPMMLKARQDIRPPSITGGGTLDQKWLTIEVGADGRCYLDGDEVPVDALRDAFAARLPMLQGKNLVV